MPRRLGEALWILTLYLKSVFASGANYVVLSLGFGKTEHCLAFWAFAVNVGLSVAEFVFAELEKSAELFVLTSSCRYVS